MKVTILILSILLLASNAFWLLQAIDNGVTVSYRDQHIHQLEETRIQLMKMLPEASKSMAKDELVAVAKKYTNQEVFEKDGCTWVGWLGLKFDDSEKLISVSPSWSFGENDPCYPSND